MSSPSTSDESSRTMVLRLPLPLLAGVLVGGFEKEGRGPREEEEEEE